MAERIPLVAKKGEILTNGRGTYGFDIYVEVGKSEDEYYPIPIEEYEAMMNAPEEERATDEDYQNALRELGVNV